MKVEAHHRTMPPTKRALLGLLPRAAVVAAVVVALLCPSGGSAQEEKAPNDAAAAADSDFYRQVELKQISYRRLDETGTVLLARMRVRGLPRNNRLLPQPAPGMSVEDVTYYVRRQSNDSGVKRDTVLWWRSNRELNTIEKDGLTYRLLVDILCDSVEDGVHILTASRDDVVMMFHVFAGFEDTAVSWEDFFRVVRKGADAGITWQSHTVLLPETDAAAPPHPQEPLLRPTGLQPPGERVVFTTILDLERLFPPWQVSEISLSRDRAGHLEALVGRIECGRRETDSFRAVFDPKRQAWFPALDPGDTRLLVTLPRGSLAGDAEAVRVYDEAVHRAEQRYQDRQSEELKLAEQNNIEWQAMVEAEKDRERIEQAKRDAESQAPIEGQDRVHGEQGASERIAAVATDGDGAIVVDSDSSSQSHGNAQAREFARRRAEINEHADLPVWTTVVVFGILILLLPPLAIVLLRRLSRRQPAR